MPISSSADDGSVYASVSSCGNEAALGTFRAGDIPIGANLKVEQPIFFGGAASRRGCSSGGGGSQLAPAASLVILSGLSPGSSGMLGTFAAIIPSEVWPCLFKLDGGASKCWPTTLYYPTDFG